MSQQATTDTKAPAETNQKDSSQAQTTPGSSRSAPRDFPASGRGRHSQGKQGYGTSPSDAPLGPPRHSGSYDSSRHTAGHRSSAHSYGSSPSGDAGGGGSYRRTNSGGGGSSAHYGQWPPPGSSPADSGGLPRAGGSSGSSSRPGSRQGSGGLRPSSSSGRSSGRNFTFNWPAYMGRSQLQQVMKRGQVFRSAQEWMKH